MDIAGKRYFGWLHIISVLLLHLCFAASIYVLLFFLRRLIGAPATFFPALLCACCGSRVQLCILLVYQGWCIRVTGYRVVYQGWQQQDSTLQVSQGSLQLTADSTLQAGQDSLTAKGLASALPCTLFCLDSRLRLGQWLFTCFATLVRTALVSERASLQLQLSYM